MKHDRAVHLSKDARAFYLNHKDYDTDQATQLDAGLYNHARFALPEVSVAAVVEHDDGLPLILVATDTHVFGLDAAPFGDGPVANTRLRMWRLDPEAGSFREASSFSGSRTRELARRTRWELRVEDLELEIHTRTHPDDDADEREILAQYIARALGWPGPDSGQSGLAEVA